MNSFQSSMTRSHALALPHWHMTALMLTIIISLSALSDAAQAHPPGNFTINHFARVEVGDGQARLRYVVDMAEIPTFQEMQALDAGENGQRSGAALDAYLQRVTAQYADGLILLVDGARVPLEKRAATIQLRPGVGGLPTLRVECDYEGAFPAEAVGGAAAAVRGRELP